jgi:hypothetical protein
LRPFAFTNDVHHASPGSGWFEFRQRQAPLIRHMPEAGAMAIYVTTGSGSPIIADWRCPRHASPHISRHWPTVPIAGVRGTLVRIKPPPPFPSPCPLSPSVFVLFLLSRSSLKALRRHPTYRCCTPLADAGWGSIPSAASLYHQQTSDAQSIAADGANLSPPHPPPFGPGPTGRLTPTCPNNHQNLSHAATSGRYLSS